ncbi:MAG TPA: helix-turn-helix domain-containing protein [Methanomassiliicoccales archaeon]|nr:helix-turn-helix domain-containing protein [Methanomassiliicoccales archaeon]
MPGVVDHLVRLGLSEYESRAYVAIVTLGEATVKEISEESGVPRSRAYDVMHRLAEKGFVEVGSSSPRCYRANEPTAASSQLMEEIRHANEEILRDLSEIGRRANAQENPIWTVKGDWAIDHKVSEVTESARREVTVLCFNNRSVIRYAKVLSEAARQKDVTVLISPQIDGFDGLLGRCHLMTFEQTAVYPFEIGGVLEDKGFVTSDGRYCIEMLMRTDQDVSLLLTREGEARRAMVIFGTILNVFTRQSIELLVRGAVPAPSGPGTPTQNGRVK